MGENHICKKCGGIAGWDPYFNGWVCTRCNNIERKKPTNAEKIRAMNDDSLAEWIAGIIDCSVCKHRANSGDNCPKEIGQTCYEYFLSWLKQETKEERGLVNE